MKTINQLLQELTYKETGRYFLKKCIGGKHYLGFNADYIAEGYNGITFLINCRKSGNITTWQTNKLSTLKKICEAFAKDHYQYGYGKTEGKNKYQIIDRKTGKIVYSV